jgi:hypothetical protein
MAWEVMFEAGRRLALLMYDFQTLIAGMIALGAARWTVREMQQQTRVAEQQEAVRRRGRYLAARAMLPLALTELCEYARLYIGAFKAGHVRVRDGMRGHREPIPVPSLHETARRNLAAMLEAEDRDAVHEAIAEILRFVQLMEARGSDWLNPREGLLTTRHHFETQMAMAACLHALASSLFAYARGETDEHDASAVERCARGSFLALDLAGFGEASAAFERLLASRDDFWKSPFTPARDQ